MATILGGPILWLSVFLPVLAGLIAWLAKAESEDAARITAGVSAILLAIPGALVAGLYAAGMVSQGVLDPVYAHFKGIGTLALAIDGLNAPIVLGVSAVTAAVAVYSVRYMLTRIEEMKAEGEDTPGMGAYFFLYNTFAAAMLGLAMATNLVLFYIFLELTLVPSFLLIAYWGYGDRKRISLLYFVWTHIGAVLLLTGIIYYGVKLGTFDYLLVPQLKPLGPIEGALGSAAKIVAVLMSVGLFVKMAVFGVHMWLPYAHAEAPTPISALLSPNLIGLAGYAYARFVIPSFPTILAGWRDFLVALAFTTIIYGGLVALTQRDFKKFLAYSSVSQMGYMLLGLATLTSIGIAGAMMHYLVHAIGKALLFMTAGVFITDLHSLRDIRLMGGLARKYPLTAALALYGFLHLAGMPPSPGIWSEWMILVGLYKVYNHPLTTLFSLALVTAVALTVSAAYSFITMRRIFYGQPRSDRAREARETRNAMIASMFGLLLVGFLVFILATPVINSLMSTVSLVIAGLH
ncbi:MAG: NADH-quinone oxidoreductase subunit M [Desulfurococcales archaeon]|nr:NADH-quinone oxidoreductase subunit M [Desulfurococcales archaeon]